MNLVIPLSKARLFSTIVDVIQVSVTAREDVPHFGPKLPNPAIFKKVCYCGVARFFSSNFFSHFSFSFLPVSIFSLSVPPDNPFLVKNAEHHLLVCRARNFASSY